MVIGLPACSYMLVEGNNYVKFKDSLDRLMSLFEISVRYEEMLIMHFDSIFYNG